MKEIKNKGFEFEIDTSELISNLLENSISLGLAISTGEKEEILKSIIPFINVFSSVNIKNSKERIIFKYIKNSLEESTVKVLSYLDKDKISHKEVKTLSKKLPKKEKAIYMDTNILSKPGKSLIAQKYIDLLCNSLERIGTIDELDVKMIKNLWDNVFSRCANEEWENNIQTYSTINNEDLLSPMHKYVENLNREEQYKNQLKKMMESEVFGNTCILKDIFIDLNCVSDCNHAYLETGKIKSSMETLNKWSASNEGGMVLLEGDPGSGKSTLLKELASNLINKYIKVIYFNLFKLNFSNKKDCIDVVKEELNNLGWYNELEYSNDSNVVYIFDGLDEIKCDVWGNAVELVQQLIQSDYYIKQKIIISGRKRIIEHCHEKIGDIPTITILPLRVNTAEKKDGLDIRSHMWEKLKNVFDLDFNFSEIANKENLNELSENPLLMFLLAWTFKNEPNSFDKIDNSVQLYRQILHCIYNRNYNRKKEEYLENKIEYKSYLKILYAIGACAWQNNSREIPVSAIKDYCKTMHLANEYEKWFEDKECVGSSKLFLIFFAHEKHNFDDSFFEFIHKSFYEYLSIEEIMQLVFKVNELSDEQIIKSVCFLFSRNYIDTDFIYYYIEEMYSSNLNMFIRFKYNICYIESLIGYKKIDEIIYSNGMSTQLFEYKNLQDFFSGYKYIRENIWRLIEYIFIIYSKNPKLSIKTDLCLHDVHLYDLNIKMNNLNHLILIDCDLDNLTITYIKFNNGKWNNCKVSDCIFCQGGFEQMILTSVKFYTSHLEAVSFSRSQINSNLFDGVSLDASYITDAKVHDTIFDNCTFCFANFDDSLFTDVKFFNCVFDYADFNNAIFHKCEFDNCSFKCTKLTNVNIKDFINESGNLIEALLEANYEDATFEGLPHDVIKRFEH